MTTTEIVNTLREAGQDFEWYPTTDRMIAAITADLYGEDSYKAPGSILDIGAGDGRVLTALANKAEHAKLFAIEKSAILQQQQPDRIVPVGCDFHEQNLMTLPVDVLFSNPPYSEFEEWAERIIRTAYARTAYLILPQRWEQSAGIAAALKARDAHATILHRDDFHDAERQARAVVHILRVTFEAEDYRSWNRRSTPAQDPFDVWFDEHIDTFDREAEISDSVQAESQLARIRSLDNIPAMVEAYDEEYARMEENYRAIFRLDLAILKELGVDKTKLREGLKTRMAGLKNVYWQGLFERLDVITSRLTTKTKRGFLDRLTGQTSIAFTCDNAYAVVLWAIRAANAYFDGQVVDFFRELSTREGSTNYTSNQRTWEGDRWRYAFREHFSHYTLDYRIVQPHHAATPKSADTWKWEYPGGLHNSAHEIIDDAIAVMGNLGFRVVGTVSRSRMWRRNVWQDFYDANGETVFQVKGFDNGNLQWRFHQDAIKALNIEAGRLLGWIRTQDDAVTETGYSRVDVAKYFGQNQRISTTTVRLLPPAHEETNNATTTP